jgi:hypothetical protein
MVVAGGRVATTKADPFVMTIKKTTGIAKILEAGGEGLAEIGGQGAEGDERLGGGGF